jgi:acyl-CoA synthetase (AMP-forming)/AMP-acid ligase II
LKKTDIQVIQFDNVEQVPDHHPEEHGLIRMMKPLSSTRPALQVNRKGCLLTHGKRDRNARQISEWLGFTEADRLLSIMPLFHMNAVSVTTMSALYAGASTVVSPKFSASRFWQIISDYQITSFGSVATMLSMLLSTYPDGVPAGLNTQQLRFAMCGSAPVPAEVMKRFEETFDCLVVEGYGLSESTCRSTFNPPDQRRRPGSCGVLSATRCAW